MAEERIFVVGAGTMGRGIAGICALSGHETWIFDADPGALRAARDVIEASWARAAEKGRIRPESVAQASRRLRIASGLREAREVDLVVEAVPESLALKRSVFEELDGLCPPGTVLATNTSSLSITRIALGTGRADRVVGIHFFNPVAAMPLVEIICGRETSAETESRAVRFVESLGKRPIRVTDAPGFATSRLGLALGLEAMRMVEEGVAGVVAIDLAMELGYGHRMGPLKTSDLVGLDVRLAIAEALAAELSAERFAPPQVLRTHVAAGRLGKKTGEGFYRWEGDLPVAPVADATGERRKV